MILQRAFSHACLLKCDFFAGMDEDFLNELMRELSVEMFQEGDVIVRQGQVADQLYVLQTGEVEVLLPLDSGGEIQVATLQGGTIFGAMAFFSSSTRQKVTVRALRFCDCRVVHRRALQPLMQRYPKVRQSFEQLAQQRLSQLQVSNDCMGSGQCERRCELRCSCSLLSSVGPRAVAAIWAWRFHPHGAGAARRCPASRSPPQSQTCPHRMWGAGAMQLQQGWSPLQPRRLEQWQLPHQKCRSRRR